MQYGRNARVNGVRIRADQRSRGAIRSGRLVQHNDSRTCLRQLRFVTRVGQKRQRAPVGALKGRDVVDARVGIAAQFAAEPNGELSKRDDHNVNEGLQPRA